MDARVAREAGHEVFACAVPPTEQLDGKFLGARLTDGDHNKAISVTASTWPWRQRSKTYGIAVTFMGKDVACGLLERARLQLCRDAGQVPGPDVQARPRKTKRPLLH